MGNGVYLVSPGGALTWQQACAREAEFADGPNINVADHEIGT